MEEASVPPPEPPKPSLEGIVIIGMDPPVSRNCGWSVARMAGNKLVLLEKFTQVIEKPEGDMSGLEDVYGKLEELIKKYGANVLCMERQMGMGLAFARAKLNEFVGVSKLCCLRNGIKVVEVSPGHLKLLITGYGAAKKKHIMANVRSYFGLDKSGVEHECDAAAFTLVYCIDNGWNGYEIAVPFTAEDKKNEKARKARLKKKKLERLAKESKPATI